MNKMMNLCDSCATKLGTAFVIHKVAGAAFYKYTCAECGRKRYGGIYEIMKPRKKAARHEVYEGQEKLNNEMKGR